ncbi:PEP-CTERM motif protein [Rubripirellula amarantea]|uniref:PEP-CTERM motif protein n=1 Tax=Rubripirellula amarantea TaxID=2527999 RepID=A0A5C5WVD0_9BACT|nr:PEP-CTERM sorting domain-containing protein [Rubripirellula amarantea]TWT54657.1 PEP-CTERM motif protein [Rubripirellula amarantea]
MLRKFLCIAALAVCAANSDAGVLGSSLTFDGSPDGLTDDSVGVFIDTNSDGFADVIQGVVYLGASTKTDPDSIYNVTGGNLYAAYSIGLDLVSATATQQDYTGTAAPAGFSVLDIVNSLSQPVTDLATTFRSAGSAALAIFTDNGSATQSTNLSAFKNTGAANSALDLNYTGTATEFDVVMVAGFDGIDDYYTITNYILGGGFFTGTFDGAFTVLRDEFNSSVQYVPIDDGVALGDIVIASQGNDPAGAGSFSRDNTNGFTFGDEANFLINPVPEPATVLAFVGIGAIGLGARRRRRTA